MNRSANLLTPMLSCLVFMALTASDSLAQSGLNGGKPIVTYNTYGPLPIIKSQTPPSFPGGESKLNAFVLNQLEQAQTPIIPRRKTWLIATLDSTGKIVELVPTADSNPTLKNQVTQVGRSMPRWNPGTINGQGVETKFQFLLRR